MAKLSPTQIFPVTSGITDPATKKYADKMNTFLDDLIRKIAAADDVCQVQEMELIKSGNQAGGDGNLKFSYDGVNILEQIKVAGTWTTVRTISGS